MLYLGVALFLLAVGMSAAALMKVIASSARGVSTREALLWAAVLAVCWGAWYVVQGRTL